MSTLVMMAIDAICQRGSVRDSDVATLRRAFTLEPQLVASDIDALLRAHNLARVRDPSWADLFIETLTDYVVRELEPSGYVTAAHAGWLIARVSSAGRIRSKTEHDLLLNVIDKARWVPESLVAFALGQIRDAVSSGEGPLRVGASASAGTITLAEVEQIRALLFAYGNEGPHAITQTEIDVLLDIEEALALRQGAAPPESSTSPLEAWPAESWSDLVAKAVASAALAASGYTGPSREEALSEVRVLLGHSHGEGIVPLPMRASRLQHAGRGEGSLISAYRKLSGEAAALQRLELQRIEIITGEPVAFADAERLKRRLAGEPLRSTAPGRTLEALRSAGLELAAPLARAGTSSTIYAA